MGVMVDLMVQAKSCRVSPGKKIEQHEGDQQERDNRQGQHACVGKHAVVTSHVRISRHTGIFSSSLAFQTRPERTRIAVFTSVPQGARWRSRSRMCPGCPSRP